MSSPDKKKPGRPSSMPSGHRIMVFVDQESIDIAKELGQGNISAGFRLALHTVGEKLISGKE